MTSGKTIIYIVMSAVGVSLIPAAALAVPVVPNFTQGSNDESHRDNIEGD